MNNVYTFALLIFPTTAFCMHTQLSTVNKLRHSRSIIITNKSFDPQQSRRDAYQKYCPQQINWDQPPVKTYKMELKPNPSKKDVTEYWKWTSETLPS